MYLLGAVVLAMNVGTAYEYRCSVILDKFLQYFQQVYTYVTCTIIFSAQCQIYSKSNLSVDELGACDLVFDKSQIYILCVCKQL